MKILLMQGANMEYLGIREPEHYGTTTAAQLDAILRAEAALQTIDLTIEYTNIEGQAISSIYRADRGDTDVLLMNPAGFLYAGFALRDCLRAIRMPYVEIHMTNIDRRGKQSVTAEEADCMITGMGVESYLLALQAAQLLHNRG